jgi:hypothetical protein
LVTVSEKDINKLRKDLKKHDPQPTKWQAYFSSNINSLCKQWMRDSMPLNDLFRTLFINDEKVGQITRACLCVPHTPKKHCHGSQMTYCCCCYTSGQL